MIKTIRKTGTRQRRDIVTVSDTIAKKTEKQNNKTKPGH